MRRFLYRLLQDDDGATAVEYGLIMAVIATLLLVAFGALSDELSAMFGRLTAELAAAGSS